MMFRYVPLDFWISKGISYISRCHVRLPEGKVFHVLFSICYIVLYQMAFADDPRDVRSGTSQHSAILLISFTFGRVQKFW